MVRAVATGPSRLAAVWPDRGGRPRGLRAGISRSARVGTVRRSAGVDGGCTPGGSPSDRRERRRADASVARVVVLVVAATARELAGATGARTLCCGIGPVEAAASTARALAETRPETLLHVGVAGGRSLEPGTVVLGREAVYCDLEAAVPVVDRASPDRALLERARAALPDAVLLPIGTSARVGSLPPSLSVEAMEGFGVLRAAALAGVPAVEMRVIANAVGEPDRSRWRLDQAFDVLDGVLGRLVRALRD
jgi:futalosine hydrolase